MGPSLGFPWLSVIRLEQNCRFLFSSEAEGHAPRREVADTAQERSILGKRHLTEIQPFEVGVFEGQTTCLRQ